MSLGLFFCVGNGFWGLQLLLALKLWILVLPKRLKLARDSETTITARQLNQYNFVTCS